MSFQSPFFLFAFLPATLIAWLIPQKKIRMAYLALLSCIFYLSSADTMFFFMVLIISANYLCARSFSSFSDKASAARKRLLIAAISGNVLILIGWRYGDWLCQIAGSLGLRGCKALHLPQPLGISFIVFMLLAYLIDVYRCVIPAEKNIGCFGFFSLMFAKVVAGPIEHYQPFQHALAQGAFNLDDLYAGIRRFIIGLAKKVMIADALAKTTHAVFATPGRSTPCP